MRYLAFVVVSLLAVRAADAGELNSAALRGSRVDEFGPSYPVFERQPIYRDPRGYDIVPPSYGSATTVQPVPVAALPGYSFEVGARYWYSSGKLAKDLFDDPRFSDVLNSRLTYDGLTAHSFEAFGRIDLPSGLFLKGFAGIAGLSKGKLNDEDFPPGIDPYSSTLSDQTGGRLNYAAIDFGYAFVANARATVSLFGGYGFVGEKVNAYGCSQIATSPICDPSIPSSVLGITEDVNRANAEAAEYVFSKWLIEERLDRWKDWRNYQILPLYGKTGQGYEWDYESPVSENSAELNAAKTANSNAAVTMTKAGYDSAEVLSWLGMPEIPYERPAVAPIMAPGMPQDSTGVDPNAA